MENSPTDLRIRFLSRLATDALDSLSARKEVVSREALAQALAQHPEIQTLLAAVPETAQRNRLELEKALSQRNELMRQTAQFEDTLTDIRNFQKRTLPLLAELARRPDCRGLNRSIEDFKQLVRKGADLSDLEQGFQRLKDNFLKYELDGFDQGRAPAASRSAFSKWIKGRETTPSLSAEQLRAAYQDIVDELKMLLDESVLAELSEIEAGIRAISRPEDAAGTRSRIIGLLQRFADTVGRERKETAAFIQEIGKRLADMETHLIGSLPEFQKELQASEELNRTISGEMETLRSQVGFSQSLSELKESVISTLSAIQQALERKRQADQVQMGLVDQKMGLLQKGFSQMKQQLDSAQQQARQLAMEALTDPLTGIYNRRAYEKRISEELQRYIRHGHAFCVLLYDVDHFKRVNDRYGHGVGDLCLREIVKRIQPLLRKSDFMARVGGEEFVVVLPETEVSGAQQVAEKLRKNIESIDFIHKYEKFKVTISIGVTQVSPTDGQPVDIFDRVDGAMYHAKRNGRNRVVTQGL
jgi:diguanylate cyclase